MIARLLESTLEHPVWIVGDPFDYPYISTITRGLAGEIVRGGAPRLTPHFPYGYVVEDDSVLEWERPEFW